jgi:hypothetical protein
MMNSYFSNKVSKIKPKTKKQTSQSWKNPTPKIPEAPTIQTGDDEVVF